MDTNDRRAIEELFERLAEVERRTGPRDAGAETFIAQKVAAQPGAPYYMAQTIVVQGQALEAAQRRIAELEELAENRSGGLFGGIFGGGQRAPAPVRERAYRTVPDTGGGGFLAGAAQTALGVAGGVLLANLVTGAFAGGAAYAAEPQDQGGDDGGDVGGEDFDAGGDFDFGGDF